MKIALRLTRLSTSNVTGRVEQASLKHNRATHLTIEKTGAAKIASFNGVRALVDDYGTFSGGTENNRIFGQFTRNGGVQVLTEQYLPHLRTSVHGVFEAAAPTHGAAFRLALNDDPVFAAIGRSSAVNSSFAEVVTDAAVKKLGLPPQSSQFVKTRRDREGLVVEVTGLSGLPGHENFRATVNATGLIHATLFGSEGETIGVTAFQTRDLAAPFNARIRPASLAEQTIGVIARSPLAARDLANVGVALATEKLGQTPFEVQTPAVTVKSFGATIGAVGVDLQTAPSSDTATFDLTRSLRDGTIDATLVRNGHTHTTTLTLDALMGRMGVLPESPR